MNIFTIYRKRRLKRNSAQYFYRQDQNMEHSTEELLCGWETSCSSPEDAILRKSGVGTEFLPIAIASTRCQTASTPRFLVRLITRRFLMFLEILMAWALQSTALHLTLRRSGRDIWS